MLTTIRFILLIPLSFALFTAAAQTTLEESRSVAQASPQEMLNHLAKLADEAHTKGDIVREIEYRRDLSVEAWNNFARDPESPGTIQLAGASCISMIFHSGFCLRAHMNGRRLKQCSATINQRWHTSV